MMRWSKWFGFVSSRTRRHRQSGLWRLSRSRKGTGSTSDFALTCMTMDQSLPAPALRRLHLAGQAAGANADHACVSEKSSGIFTGSMIVPLSNRRLRCNR